MIRKYIMLAAGVLRLFKEKIWNLNALKLDGIKYYIGHNVRIMTSNNGRCYLGKKTWLSDNCYLSANGGYIELGNNNYFNSNCKIVALQSIKIGDNNLFGPNSTIVDHNHRYEDSFLPICKQGYVKKEIVIGSDVWIGANVTICAGTVIGDHVVIGANSVVSKSIIQPGVYAGCPAKKIKEKASE